MVKGKKTISNNSVMAIATLKNNMRFAINPFSGTSYVFNTALKELRKEGIIILYNKDKCHYYNQSTVSKIWGYNK